LFEDAIIVVSSELRVTIGDDPYNQWRAVLSPLEGLHLIAHTATGQLYSGRFGTPRTELKRLSRLLRAVRNGSDAVPQGAASDPAAVGHIRPGSSLPPDGRLQVIGRTRVEDGR